ncbi:YrhB domain-containing protein [Streptomyces sp. NPDC059402]|uniref:YrhB domain-containing protein n=1 Tax=Streptomyces sp. NPDC059402 TaxID=3346822 RepID=UPI0036934695
MLSRNGAVSAALNFLQKEAYPDRAESVVMLPELGIEYPFGWAVRFDFEEHIKTGDRAQAPFTSVVIVPHDGSEPHFPPTNLPVEKYMGLRVSGDWPSQRGQ